MRFYVLGEIRRNKFVQAILPYTENEKISPPWKFVRGLLKADISSLPFERNFGRVLTENIPFLYTGLISDRFKNKLEEDSITGWDSAAVRFKLKRGEYLDNYNFLMIRGTVGPLNYKAGELKERIIDLKVRKSVIPYRLGIGIDESTWDGSDMFMSTDTSGYVFRPKKQKLVSKV